MAWTQADVDAIELAAATGVQRVKLSDGREVEYRSVSDLMKARDAIKQSLHVASGGTMATYGKFVKD
jgi:hypothetical protein